MLAFQYFFWIEFDLFSLLAHGVFHTSVWLRHKFVLSSRQRCVLSYVLCNRWSKRLVCCAAKSHSRISLHCPKDGQCFNSYQVSQFSSSSSLNHLHHPHRVRGGALFSVLCDMMVYSAALSSIQIGQNSVFWLPSDCFLTSFLLSSDCFLAAFWLPSDCFLTSNLLLTVFSLSFLTYFWLSSDFLLTVFWLPFDFLRTFFIGLFHPMTVRGRYSILLLTLYFELIGNICSVNSVSVLSSWLRTFPYPFMSSVPA